MNLMMTEKEIQEEFRTMKANKKAREVVQKKIYDKANKYGISQYTIDTHGDNSPSLSEIRLKVEELEDLLEDAKLRKVEYQHLGYNPIALKNLLGFKS